MVVSRRRSRYYRAKGDLSIVKKFGVLTLLIFCSMAFAKGQDPKNKATALAISTFKKFQKNITSLSVECITFVEEGAVKSKSDMDINVQEKHGGKCSGDPNTNPSVAHLRVKGQKVFIMDVVSGDYRILNSNYKPEY